jgi:hypothetical protein
MDRHELYQNEKINPCGALRNEKEWNAKFDHQLAGCWSRARLTGAADQLINPAALVSRAPKLARRGQVKARVGTRPAGKWHWLGERTPAGRGLQQRRRQRKQRATPAAERSVPHARLLFSFTATVHTCDCLVVWVDGRSPTSLFVFPGEPSVTDSIHGDLMFPDYVNVSTFD